MRGNLEMQGPTGTLLGVNVNPDYLDGFKHHVLIHMFNHSHNTVLNKD
ncbi:hypothetical protein [Candidatus Nitrosocosmicus sp. R]